MDTHHRTPVTQLDRCTGYWKLIDNEWVVAHDGNTCPLHESPKDVEDVIADALAEANATHEDNTTRDNNIEEIERRLDALEARLDQD
jgi:hypothetical protein